VSAIYWASAEVLIAAVQLGAERDFPAPSDLRETFVGALQQMVSRCRAAGVPDPEIAEAHYALVAFIDERILKSNWPGRTEWMNSPLQLQIYREFRAGENFFARLGALLQRPQAPMALEIYYLCLALGFTGAASGVGSSQNPRAYLDAAGARLPRGRLGAPLSPHALPTDHSSATAPRRSLAVGLAIGCALVVALGLAILWWSLGSTLEGIGRELAWAALRASHSGVEG
jgi:type VI secretion system protein ImpK